MAQKHFGWVCFLVCVILAALGLTNTADNVTHRVLDLVDQLTWLEAAQPFYMPFPIDAEAFRPLSAMGLKAYVVLIGTGTPPFWFLFIKSTTCLLLFAFTARHWLRAVGLKRHAELAALLPLGLAPVLFQVWYLPELDLLGAAATLMAGAILLKREPLSRLEAVLCLALVVFSLFLKESTALIQIAFLGGTGLALWLQNLRGKRFKRHCLLCFGAAGLWGTLVLLLLGGEASQAGKASFWMRVDIVEHNLVQVLYLLSASGAVLVALGGILSQTKEIRSRLKWILPSSIILLILAPLAVFYSHYEAVYFAPRWMGIGFALVLFSGLIMLATSQVRDPAPALVALQILCVTGLLSLAGVLAPNAREDIASRVFVILAPGLFALAFYAGDSLHEALIETKASVLPRLSLKLLLVALVYTPGAQALNYTFDWRARHAVDYKAKQVMARLDKADLILFNHYVEWLDPLGLIAAGAPENVKKWRFLHVPAWLPVSEYDQAHWILPYHIDLVSEIKETSTHIYWQSPKLQGGIQARETLQGDLSWTRKSLGLFSPIAKNQHNRPEDHRMTVYQQGPSHLEKIMEQGDSLWSGSARSWQLPLNLFEGPRRLISRAPLVEQFKVEGQIVHLPPGRFQVE